jgi:hypothetical protein
MYNHPHAYHRSADKPNSGNLTENISYLYFAALVHLNDLNTVRLRGKGEKFASKTAISVPA